ncbi:MAG: hypothetical protein P8M63_06015 [Paracoccaceae bacterium]|jgi:mannose/fructose/N-acetylgalactosamine-specific phosphotransferase system component IID|nr:hypothetical protein [Paracoccaceae bacterium]
MKYFWCAFVMFFTCWLCIQILMGEMPVTPYDTSTTWRDGFQSAENLAIKAIKNFGEIRTALGTFVIGALAAAAVLIWPN